MTAVVTLSMRAARADCRMTIISLCVGIRCNQFIGELWSIYATIRSNQTKTDFTSANETVIFPGCPAQRAGLQFGDILLQANDHVFQQTDMQGEYWRILDGRAGTNVALTVRRGDQTLTVTLTRMNIEDVEDGTLRRIFERMLRTLGPPIATPTASETAPSSWNALPKLERSVHDSTNRVRSVCLDSLSAAKLFSDRPTI